MSDTLNLIPSAQSPLALARSIPPWRGTVRVFLFLYVVLVACPIRYWPLADDFDNSWVFGINYAAAHGLSIGQDFVFTTGPLGYLAVPIDLGHNLVKAFAFQAGLWAVLCWVFWDLILRCRLPLRNLAAFAVCFGLSTPLYWFNRIGVENLLLAGAFLALVAYRWRGGTERLLVALVLIGVAPMIKLSSALLGVGALAGFLVDGVVQRRPRMLREIGLALAVPTVSGLSVCALTVPSFAAFTAFLKGSSEQIKGYSAAMSFNGPNVELAMAVATIFLIAALLVIVARVKRSAALFSIMILALPLAASFKHGFVRQDLHVVNFFCFAALALGLILLSAVKLRVWWLLVVLAPFAAIWQERVSFHIGPLSTAEMVTGVRGLQLLWQARDPDYLHYWLKQKSLENPQSAFRIEPGIRTVIGDAPVSSLSAIYSRAAVLDRLNFVLYPLLERAVAYTPYLDSLSAQWVREKGPGYLVFDGLAIDGRHPWVETPAMWAEVYRWYDTKLLGRYNLLLQRRAKPRFQALVSVARSRAVLTEPLRFPRAGQPVFWRIHCELNPLGKWQQLLFRLPAMTMELEPVKEAQQPYRVLPGLLTAPVLGPSLPTTLAEFADLFAPEGHGRPVLSGVSFGGPALGSYNQTCEREFLVAAVERPM